MEAVKRKGGAPRKAPKGLTEALFVRTDKRMKDALNKIVARHNKSGAIAVRSVGDLVRAILWEAIEADATEHG